MLKRRSLLCAVLTLGLINIVPGYADSLDSQLLKAYRKIGVGPDQTEAYAVAYEKFLKKRNAYVRRALHRASGEEVPVKTKKAAARAARGSMKVMRKVLSEHQLEYFEQYVKLSNKQFLRDAGLR